MNLHTVTVASTAAPAEGLTLLELTAGDWSGSHERPGQYLMFQAPFDDKPRPIAIASAPGRDPVALLLKAERDRQDALRALSPGDTVSCSSPAGPGFPVDQLGDELPGEALILVATGTALAPIKTCLDVLIAKGRLPPATSLYVGARREADLAFPEELSRYRQAGVTVETIFSQPEANTNAGHVQALLTQPPSSPRTSVVFSCGQPQMMQEVEDIMAGFDVPRPHMFRNF